MTHDGNGQDGATITAPPPLDQRAPLNKKELSADHPTWCPGCGDFSVLALYFKLMEKRQKQIPRENYATIAGIGCSSRFPFMGLPTKRWRSIKSRASATLRHRFKS